MMKKKKLAMGSPQHLPKNGWSGLAKVDLAAIRSQNANVFGRGRHTGYFDEMANAKTSPPQSGVTGDV